MKKLLFYAVAVLAAISFSACSGDDENGLPATPENIAGTWQLTLQECKEFVNGKKTDAHSHNYPDEEGRYKTYSFDKSSTCIRTSYYHEKVSTSQEGTYSISGNKITFVGIDSGAFSSTLDEATGHYSSTLEIKKLTESQLVLFDRFTVEDENYSEERIWTYKRIE